MTLPDLSDLTLIQVFALLAAVSLCDLVMAILAAIAGHRFTFDLVSVWLESHVLTRIFPIFALAVLGHGIAPLSLPPLPPAFALALAGLATYVLETVGSIQESLAMPTERAFPNKVPDPAPTPIPPGAEGTS